MKSEGKPENDSAEGIGTIKANVAKCQHRMKSLQKFFALVL